MGHEMHTSFNGHEWIRKGAKEQVGGWHETHTSVNGYGRVRKEAKEQVGERERESDRERKRKKESECVDAVWSASQWRTNKFHGHVWGAIAYMTGHGFGQ